MSGKARERESDEKCVKKRYAAGRTGGSQRDRQGIRKADGSAESKYTTENRMPRAFGKGRTGEERQRNRTGRKCGDERADREMQRDGRGETERRIEKYNVTEVGRRRDEQGATKKRKGAEFLKGLHLRAGFGIMER